MTLCDMSESLLGQNVEVIVSASGNTLEIPEHLLMLWHYFRAFTQSYIDVFVESHFYHQPESKSRWEAAYPKWANGKPISGAYSHVISSDSRTTWGSLTCCLWLSSNNMIPETWDRKVDMTLLQRGLWLTYGSHLEKLSQEGQESCECPWGTNLMLELEVNVDSLG